jgi:hypothetical protein
MYTQGLSKYPVLFFLVWTASLLLNEGAMAAQTWFLGFWSVQYETKPASEVSAPL